MRWTRSRCTPTTLRPSSARSRRRERVYEKAKEQRDMNKQMENMLNIIDDDEAEDAQKRRNAANNILVLAREEATANQLCAKGGVAKLK